MSLRDISMRIVLLGAPGSGKGTQAKKLMAEKNIPQVSTGDILRGAVVAGTEYGDQAKKIMEAGELVPDAVMLGIISDRLVEDDAADGFILDGYPRTVKQALDLENLLEKMIKPLDTVILMDVDFDILMKRLTGRRTCSLTGKLLNIHFSPQQELDACTEAGGELIEREDDNEQIISNRLEIYRSQTEPLIDFYRGKGKLKIIDAAGSIEQVFERFNAALNN